MSQKDFPNNLNEKQHLTSPTQWTKGTILAAADSMPHEIDEKGLSGKKTELS